jgi:site-specific recombinase XerD
VSALRFLYKVTLKRDWPFELIQAPKSETRLPVILSPEEVLRLLQAAPSFSHHVIFSTMYGTGVRVSEAVHLRAADIDSGFLIDPHLARIADHPANLARRNREIPLLGDVEPHRRASR